MGTAVGRVLDHFARAELTLPPNQLPWRSGPVVRGLRLLPVRYELGAGAPAGSRRAAPSGAPATPAAKQEPRGLLAILRKPMFVGR